MGVYQLQTIMTEATANGKQFGKRFAIFEHDSGFQKSCIVSTTKCFTYWGHNSEVVCLFTKVNHKKQTKG